MIRLRNSFRTFGTKPPKRKATLEREAAPAVLATRVGQPARIRKAATSNTPPECTSHYAPYSSYARFGWMALHTVNFLGAVHLFLSYVGTVSTMSGPSMLPTLANAGEIVIENRWSRFNLDNLQRGDLITLYSPLDRTRVICKRVIGLPGDVVCVDPTGQYAPSTEHVLVPEGHIWIIGDNAAYSRDSRQYGPVSMGLIRGSLYARIWPFKDSKIFRNPTTYLDY